MKILRVISVIIAGSVFIFSGFVKGVDPMGSAYKFHDYFMAFGFGFLSFLSMPLAILLCTAEFMAGFSVITGVFRKWGIIVMTILMLIFTPLTLVLALTNPVSDCGCFGDAVHLTNWQTFSKNIILLIPVLFLFYRRNRMNSTLSIAKEKIIASLMVILFIGFCFFNLAYLPVIDFLPYKKGTRIADKMIIPEGAKPDVYRTTFIYEKNGERKEFELNNYPADDTTWKFIDQKSVLIEKGYVPPIHDFTITDQNGEDITSRILDAEGYTLLMISKKLGESDEKHLAAGFQSGKDAVNKGIAFYVLTASGRDEIKKFGTEFQICTSDETTLKTMIRANPGFILLKKGVITGKWSWASLPSESYFDQL